MRLYKNVKKNGGICKNCSCKYIITGIRICMEGVEKKNGIRNAKGYMLIIYRIERKFITLL